MIIKSLELENWKCFPTKRSFDFKIHELIKMKNGMGKTSIFEGIMYAIRGKPPVGFNLNTVRNDDKRMSRVFICFALSIEGEMKEVTIERVFGSNHPISELRVEGTLVCESVRTIDEWMDKVINQKIAGQLWTSSLIQSDIMSVSFFNNSILEDILTDPLALVAAYKSKILVANRRINSFNEAILDVSEIEARIESIKAQLKEKSDGDINLAKTSEAASGRIEIIDKAISKLVENGKSIPSLSDAKMFMTLLPKREAFQKELDAELAKKANIFSKLNANEVRKIVNESLEAESCIICGGEFNQEKHDATLKEMSLAGRSEERIKKLQDQLKLLEYDRTAVESVIEMEAQTNILNRCKNYKQIIDSYNEDNNKLWADFERAQKDYALALKQQEQLKEINQLRLDVEQFKIKLDVLNSYVKEASTYYTNKIMEKASQYFHNMNNRYKQVCMYEGAFHVVVEQADFSLNLLPAVRLSSGEKTMCALSLLMAIRNIVVPELPLLFDETFAALDDENLEQVQKFLRGQQCQIMIITHHQNWNEF